MHIHILGICGTFMGGLAALAREAGHKVTGCDTGVYPPMSDQLRALGIELIEGFGADQLDLKPDMFVIGNVVSRAHLPDGTPKFPLMEAILDAGLPYTSGPQWLADHVLQGRHVLAVAGTHGKTTTTAMLAWILQSAGLQPGFLVGGVPMNFDVSARLGNVAPTFTAAPASAEADAAGTALDRPMPEATSLRPGQFGAGRIGAAMHRPEGADFSSHEPGTGDATWGGPSKNCRLPFFVIEADEYDTAFFDKRSKFVHYRPRTAVLNNLEFDHADIFDDLAAIERQFHHLVRTMPSTGRVVVNGLEESLVRVLNAGCWSDIRSFGAAVSDFTAHGEPDAFDVLYQGTPVGRVEWALTGVHNQLNALAAIAAADHVGVSPATAAKALASFQNVKRRMEIMGRVAMAGRAPVRESIALHGDAARAANASGSATTAASDEITLYDDFAHHPTAIRTTVDGLRRKLGPSQRILAVFEPRSNTMKLGAMKAQLPWSLEDADLAFCHSGGLGWDAREALAPMGARAFVADSIDALVGQVIAHARGGDHIVCMSNGGFGGVHLKLLQALQK